MTDSSSLTENRTPSGKRKLTSIEQLAIILLPILGMVTICGWIGARINLAAINVPNHYTAEDYLTFEINYHDVVTIQGQGLTGELSSWDQFSLIGNQQNYIPTSSTLPLVVADTDNDHGRTLYLVKGPIKPGKYQVVSPLYADLQIELWGQGPITVDLTRSSYEVDFGPGATLFGQIIGGAIGAVLGILLSMVLLTWARK